MVQNVGNEAINKAVIKIHNMSADDRMRERAWMREMALHDEASALAGARREGRAEGRAELLAFLVKSGDLTPEQAAAYTNF